MNTMRNFLMIIVLAVAFASCSEETIAPVKTESVLTSITSSIGNYNLNYDTKGGVMDVTYVEGSSSHKYTYVWNTDSTELTRTEFHVNTNSQTSVSIFKFNADSTLAQYSKNVPNEYSVIYTFLYTNKKLSAMSIAENGESADNVTVEWSDFFLKLSFESGRVIDFVFAAGDSPFLNANPYAMATLLDKDLSIFNAVSTNMLWSIADSDEDITANQEYSDSKPLASFTRNGVVYQFNYSTIEIK